MDTYASLFTGIGGFDLALDSLGLHCVLQCELDRQCRRVLRLHWPSVRRVPRIEDIGDGEIGDVDLLCGGDPCQANSTASGGQRSSKPSLGHEFVRVVGLSRPRWVIRENPARVRRDAPWPAERFAACLEALGYACSIVDMQCAAFSGVSRDRAFVVASHPARISCLERLLAHYESARGGGATGQHGAATLPAFTCQSDRANSSECIILDADGRARVLDRAERLEGQGFPPDWLPNWVSRRTSDRMAGNAVPVPAVRWLAEKVISADAACAAAGREE